MNLKALAGKIGLDYDKTVEDFCGDISTLKEKVQSFSVDCDIDEFEDALKTGDEPLIKNIAHKIKKAAEKIGLVPLMNAASQVESADSQTLREASVSLIKMYNDVIQKIKAEN